MTLVLRRLQYLRPIASILRQGERFFRLYRSAPAVVLSLTLQWLVFASRVDAQGPQYYVAPSGSAAGDGTLDQPWDLSTALNGRKIPPGSTIWLRGGTYVGVFKSTLTGTETAPITVRQYAGERAIVSDNRERAGAGTINVMGAWTIYRDFEVTNSTTGRDASRIYRPMGFEVTGPHNKFINLVIHDAGHGMGVWAQAVDAEIYGNIIFNCGTQNELVDQGHGHGIYSQNNVGTKLIRDNIVFNQFGWGLHVWPGPGDIKGYEVEGNVFFNNGILSSPSHFDDNMAINGHAPFHAERITIVSNYTYDFPSAAPGTKFYDAGVCLACTDPQPHAGEDIVLRDNYFVGGSPVAIIGNWQDIKMSGNSFISDKGLIAFAGTKQSGARRVRWEDNQYFGRGFDIANQRGVAFLLESQALPFGAWVQETGFDRNSNYSAELPTAVKVFIRPNKYESGRANIIVYNWNRQERVEVDIRSVLRMGDHYVVLNVEDYLGEPVLSSVYDGKPLPLPMTGLRVAVPVGRSTAPRFTGPEFAVFVVRTVVGAATSLGRGQASARTVEQTETSAGPEDMSRFAGLFVSADPSAKIRVRVDSGRLVATMLNEPGQPSYPLVPVSPTRFRLEGAPRGFFADFEVTRHAVKSLTVERGPFPTVHLIPQQ